MMAFHIFTVANLVLLHAIKEVDFKLSVFGRFGSTKCISDRLCRGLGLQILYVKCSSYVYYTVQTSKRYDIFNELFVMSFLLSFPKANVGLNRLLCVLLFDFM